MNYHEALEYIHGTYKFGSKLGLENISYLLKLLGDPQKDLKIIHIAGTNGKGSTAAFINEVLKEAGYKVGLYTSPYLETFTERIRINGVNIPEEELAEVTYIVKEKIELMVKEGRNHPTEFEVVTAIAFYYYAKEKIDFLILEVGLGGRLDATNVVEKPLISVITPIGYDHMEYLGDTIEKIAFEKGGIIKDNSLVVTYPQESGAIGVIEELCTEKNSRLIVVSFDDINIHNSSIEGQEFTITVMDKAYKNIKIHMVGQHQIYNSATALTVLEALKKHHGIKIDDDSIYRGFLNTRWPGRLEVMKHDPLTIIDGAHNIHGAEALAKTLENQLENFSITLVLGMLKDKDVGGFVDKIVPLVDRVVLTKPDNPRAMEPQQLSEKLVRYNKEVYVEVEIGKAVDCAFKLTKATEAIVVAGSLYMIGEARKHIRENY
ncbi:bifunctional folylpolyglutamate synthase/dihydrofolate synthase [Alkaliphilus peptidifermentans]|uniref:Dihydrofolate synthase/folylpolyglutamate synthase n=1 Tax=Alkaliphilus peptidifermentans DSM 18978 TaxID=1120976 RepID=A0A1G5I145_9FIRM|nr:folylpolyglutamate synthase/dihydrofolate synthase family protein [Alkaliphilus peptidifermentans]SCY69661.1 dihydrofolate synthase / folylpolyglutamate synthase [Alkaliphilus peptidifermentans DSM 18978]